MEQRAAAEEIIGYDVVSDERVGDGGFLAIRRMRLRAVRRDGSRSAVFLSDYVERDKGLDAVVVGLYYRDGEGPVQVLLRQGQRPALHFGRPPARQPVPDGRRYLLFTELVAGIIEEGDRGEAGVRARAAAEAWEEAGVRVDPARVQMLGAPIFPSPGMTPERFFLTAVEIGPGDVGRPEGDGSPMEEGAAQRFVPLDEAIAMCDRGELEDGKTELLLRRLRARLG